MARSVLKNSLNIGIIFGLATVFIILIGFHTVAADLIGKMLFQQPGYGILYLSQPVFDWLLFLAILGVWAGARSVPGHDRSASQVLAAAALTGLVYGLLVGGLATLVAFLVANKVEITQYLAQMVPDNTRVLLLDGAAASPFSAYLGLLLAASLLGGALAIFFRQSAVQAGLAALWGRLRAFTGNSLPVKVVRQTTLGRALFYLVLLLAVFIMPLVIGQYWNYTLGTVGIYVLLGLGLNIVVGLAGLLDLGYVAFFAIGAYTMALLTAPAPQHLVWSFWVALPLGIALAALAGILLGIPVLRMRGDYLAIVTLGFGEIIRILSNSDLLSNFSGGPRGVPNVGGPTLFGRPFSSDIDFVYLILLAVLLIIFITNRLKDSRVGRAWIAMREDETVARAMGINTLKHKLMAFAIGAAFAGLGGALFASRNQFTGPGDHTLMVSINVLSLVIVGGMGSIPGVIAGAFVLKGLPEILRELQNYRVLFFGALLVLMMIIRPQGLIPSRERQLELTEKPEMEPPQPVHPESSEAPEYTVEEKP